MMGISVRSAMAFGTCLFFFDSAGAAEVLLRADVTSPEAMVVEETDGLTRVEIPAFPGRASVPVEIDIVLAARLDRCLSDPEACDGRERLLSGCIDKKDNDGDGLVDLDDADCVGVQGYAIVVGTDESFHLRSNKGAEAERGATFLGTVSDDDTRPPGLFHFGSLRYVDIIDPAKNGGQEGVVGVCILSLTTFVILPPVGEWAVLKIRGDLDVSGLKPGERTQPCRIDIRGPGEEGLRSLGSPVTTEVTVQGQSYPHAARDLEIVARVREFARFKRGDANSDGTLDISDVLFILGYLFLGTRAPECLDSADTDDSSRIEITDALAIFEFLFFGSSSPTVPGPFECGSDPTDDDIPCEAFSGC